MVKGDANVAAGVEVEGVYHVVEVEQGYSVVPVKVSLGKKVSPGGETIAYVQRGGVGARGVAVRQ